MMALLEVNVTVNYGKQPPVLRELKLELQEGEVLSLVGHSGCGKSSLALAILGLLGMKHGKAAGSIVFRTRELLGLSEREWKKVRGREIGFVPQSPIASLNPALRIGTQLEEAWKLHQRSGRHQRKREILRVLEEVSLRGGTEFLRRYPREISVGQAQRVLVAMAILHRPHLLIADEPTSALDAITQSEILHLFSTLNRRMGMSILYISHDLPSVLSLSHRISIIHEGTIVETGRPAQIFSAPEQPFTKRLIASLPALPTAQGPAPVSPFAGPAGVRVQ